MIYEAFIVGSQN